MGEAKTIVREFTVNNEYGIHARPAALLVKAAGKFSAEILIGKKGAEVSAKSIMGLLTIEGHKGAKLFVQTVGEDAEEAMAEIAELFENNFFEK
jgi:phosphotransferase system HPr (HPr) family protein